MQLRIDHTYYPVRVSSDGVSVDIPERRAYSAPNLVELVQRLELDFDDVSLPQACFSDDLHIVGDFLKLGFKYLQAFRMPLDGTEVVVRPTAYWSSRDPQSRVTGTGRAAYRLYQATWTRPSSSGEQSWNQILTEPELEVHINRAINRDA